VTTEAVLGKQDQRILTAIDQVVVNRPKLQLTDEAGNVVTGQLPKSLRQFSEGLDQVKKDVFAQYDGLMRRAGVTAPPIDLAPIAAQVRVAGSSTATRVVSPSVKKEADALADRLMKQGNVGLADAQDMVQHLNRKNQAFWRNPTRENVSIATIEADVAGALRTQLDQTITGLQGPGYQALRDTYGALKAVEQNVVKAVVREGNRMPKGVADYLGGISEIAHIAHGVATLNPGAIAKGVGYGAGRAYMRRMSDPNKMVQNLFKYRSDVLRQHVSQLRQSISRMVPPARSGVTAGLGAGGGAELARQQQPAIEDIQVTDPTTGRAVP
jgi:hypothetical protein